MRAIVNTLAGLTAAGLLAGIGLYQVRQRERTQLVAGVADDVKRFEQEIRFHAAADETELNSRGWPILIDPAWFGDDPPRNALLSSDRPWVEIAPPADGLLMHPRQRVAPGVRLAGFWYNPYQGVVRARVPQMISDQAAVELYNTINGTRITSIFPIDEPSSEPDVDDGASSQESEVAFEGDP